MPRTKDGKTVNAVISSKICNDSEYVVSPFSPVSVVRAGKPRHLNPEHNCICHHHRASTPQKYKFEMAKAIHHCMPQHH